MNFRINRNKKNKPPKLSKKDRAKLSVLIGEEVENNSIYQGLYQWDGQYVPCNGKPLSDDGKKLLVKEFWQDNDNPNYYLLKISGSKMSSDTQNSQNNNNNNNNNNQNNQDTGVTTIVMHEKMFDFSTGEYVTEMMTTEDLDVITGAQTGKARLIAENDAYIKLSTDEEYFIYRDVAVGDTVVLIDNEAGIATIKITKIDTNEQGFPTVSFTWSYSP